MTSAPNWQRGSQREVLAVLVSKVEAMDTTVKELRTEISSMKEDRVDEIALCVFHPARKQNGDDFMKRVESIETEIKEWKAWLRGASFWFKALPWIGTANIVALAVYAWGAISQLRIGGGP